MRIIAGQFKGRRLETPTWTGLRPTSDKLRETLFNILAPRIDGALVVDGFAGTGALGLEALSRGAAHVTFVERDARAARLVDKNVESVGAGDRHVIIRAELAGAVRRLTREDQRFDLVFLDPPYGADALIAALDAIEPVLAPGTRLIVEHARRDAAPERHGALVRTRQVLSGDSALTFYGRAPEDS